MSATPFRGMGRPLADDTADALASGTVAYLLEAMPRGEYLAWVAEASSSDVIGGARGVGRIVLHASAEGRRLYERLGFVQTNEMRLAPPTQ
jgi:hypothetical protein